MCVYKLQRTVLLALFTLLLATASMADGRDDNLFTEGFEGSWPPAGWAEINTSSANWNRTNWDSHSGTYAAWCWTNPASQNEWLVTPAIDLSAAVAPKLEWFERGYNWESNGGHHYIMVSTTSQTDPGAFTEVIHMTPANHDCGGFDGGPPATVNLTDFEGEPTVYIAVRYYGPGGVPDSWIIDDVRVYMPSGSDVGVIAVSPEGENMDAPFTQAPEVTVENFGMGTETFSVDLEILESGVSVFTGSQTVSGLAPGHLEVLSFSPYTFQPGHYYDLTATSNLAGDGDPGNDSYTGGFTTYFDTHVPLGMLFTNSGCGPCVQANEALDAYMPGQGNDVALLRIHVSWPNPGDIMYQHNPTQSNYLVGEFNVSGVPDFWLDGYVGLGYNGPGMVSALDNAKDWVSPMHLDLHWLPDTEQLMVSVVNTGNLRPDGDYQLFCSLTEDDIHHNGGNGEPVHQQAFRRMFPGVDVGVSVAHTVGTHTYIVDCPLDPLYVYENLRGTVYVRDMDSRVILQAGTAFLSTVEDATASGNAPTAFGLSGNYPNPFNPKTRIDFSLDETGPVSLKVFDPSGRLMATLREGLLLAGSHSVEWTAVDDEGRALSSGLYLLRLEADGKIDTRKLLLGK